MGDDEKTESLSENLSDLLEDIDEKEKQKLAEQEKEREHEREEEEKKKGGRRRRRTQSKRKSNLEIDNLNLEDEDEGFDIDAIYSNLEVIGEEHSDSALDDILLEECQKLTPEAIFFQIEEFTRKFSEFSVLKLELDGQEHQLNEDHKNLEEKLGVDAEQLRDIATRIHEFKQEAIIAKEQRLQEFKKKKKNLHAKTKLEEEVYTIKSKYEEKKWEQGELEDAKKAMAKEISILQEILGELEKAHTATGDIQSKIPNVSLSVKSKVKEMFEVEEFKDKFVLQLLDCQEMLRNHSLTRIETMKQVEQRVTSLQKKSMLCVQQQDFASQIFEIMLEVHGLRQFGSDITDMRLQFSVLLQVEVDALHHLLARVQQDRKRFSEQIVEENKEKKVLCDNLKKLNFDFKQVLDKGKSTKKTHKLILELVETLQPLQGDLAELLIKLSEMMYEDMIVSSHRDRLEKAKVEIQSVSEGISEVNTHHSSILDTLESAMKELHAMKEKRMEMETTLKKETETIDSLQKQIEAKKGKKGKKK